MALSQLAHAARPHTTAATKTGARMAWIDNLRVLLIAMLVVHHASWKREAWGRPWPSPELHPLYYLRRARQGDDYAYHH